MSGEGARSLSFDHAGRRYVVAADPGMLGWNLSLWRDGGRVMGFGLVPHGKVADATVDLPGADPVKDRMQQIRNAVLVGDVS